MKILFLCTGGNSCRSLMAEAFLQEMDHSLEVYSAGLHPDQESDELAIRSMAEIGIDLSAKKPKSYTQFKNQSFDYLITLCDSTTEKITDVNIQASHKIHLGFDDPQKVSSGYQPVEAMYNRIRDEIYNELDYFYTHILSPELQKPAELS